MSAASNIAVRCIKMADTENVTFRRGGGGGIFGDILALRFKSPCFAVVAGSMEALTVARKFTLVLF